MGEKHLLAGQEISVQYVGCRGEKTVCFNTGARTDQHSILVDEKNVAVRDQVSQEMRRAFSNNTIQNGFIDPCLIEVNRFIGCNRKFIPMDKGSS